MASWKTGQVLDVEVLSKHCSVCSHQKERDKDSQEYKDWWAKNKNSCTMKDHLQPWSALVHYESGNVPLRKTVFDTL